MIIDVNFFTAELRCLILHTRGRQMEPSEGQRIERILWNAIGEILDSESKLLKEKMLFEKLYEAAGNKHKHYISKKGAVC